MTIRQYYVSVIHPENEEQTSPFFPVEAESVGAAAEAAVYKWDEEQLNFSFSGQNQVIETAIRDPNDETKTYRMFVQCTFRPFYTICE